MDKAVEELQQELKLLKNEIKETLTDVREHLLNTVDNPFPIESAAPHKTPSLSPPTAAPAPAAAVSAAAEVLVGEPAPAPQAAVVGDPAAAAAPAPPPALDQPLPQPVSQPLSQPAPAPQPVQAAGPRLGPSRGERRPPSEDRGGRQQGRAPARARRDERGGGVGPWTGDNPSERPDEEAGEDDDGASDAGLDLITVVSLGPWLEDGVRRIGRKRVRSLLDVYTAIGGISTALRDVLAILVSLDDRPAKTRAVSVGESLRFLVDLDDLIWRGRQDWRRAVLASMVAGARALEEPDEEREAA